MNKLAIITLIIVNALFSCGDNKNNVTITKEEYSKLKGDTINSGYPKPFSFKHDINNSTKPSWTYCEWEIFLGQDTHEYLTNNGINNLVLIHYPDCQKCLKRDSLWKQN